MQQLKIECQSHNAEQINQLLEEAGALAVTMTDKHDDPILEPLLGTTPLWPHVVVEALYENEQSLQLAKQTLLAEYPSLTFTVEELAETDWERVCLADFKPLQFGEKLWICPSWLEPPDKSAVNLILDPGLAFGTGTHQTTALCLTRLGKTKLANKSLIDFGCGSGILAIAALKLGASHAYAVDIDTQALQATAENARINHIPESQLSIGSSESLVEPVDILVANILLAPLIQLKLRFKALLKKNGELMVSGLLAPQREQLKEAYLDSFTCIDEEVRDDWALMLFKAV